MSLLQYQYIAAVMVRYGYNASRHDHQFVEAASIVIEYSMKTYRWAVKKDGGQFDQFTGATITPRAVVFQKI